MLRVPNHVVRLLMYEYIRGAYEDVNVFRLKVFDLSKLVSAMLYDGEWLPVFDIVPDEAQLSKQRIFDRAVAEKALVFAHHFPPFPNLGTIAKKKMGWLWQPIETMG